AHPSPADALAAALATGRSVLAVGTLYTIAPLREAWAGRRVATGRPVRLPGEFRPCSRSRAEGDKRGEIEATGAPGSCWVKAGRRSQTTQRQRVKPSEKKPHVLPRRMCRRILWSM